MRRKIITLLATILVAAASRAGTLEVTQQVWGFDGHAVPDRINLLSVELSNLTPLPFDGMLALSKQGGLGTSLDAPLVEPCFLSPGARRWVQFTPYVRGEREAWTLEWGRGGGDSAKLKEPTFGPPARVMLNDADDLLALSRTTAFPLLPDNLFPPTVAATDGLHSILLDHVPRWEPVRKQAFLDWLRCGGEVHVLLGRTGRHPVFADELAVLNSAFDRARIGAGLVVRHALSRRDVTAKALEAAGCPPPKLKIANDYNVDRISNLEESLFGALGDLTRPHHNWGLIYLTIIAYGVVIGPVNYLLGRKRRGYRLTVVFFLATVAACALILGSLGRRGHDEATAVHSVALARQIDADHYDVTQWVNAFVTRGSTYYISHTAPHNLYSGCQSFEAIPGAISNGKDGVFRVEIPLYSHRAFLHRAKLAGDRIQLNVVAWKGGEGLEGLVLAPEAGFPSDVRGMWAVYRDTWYLLRMKDGRIRAGQAQGVGSQFLHDESFSTLLNRRFGRMRYDADRQWNETQQEAILAQLAYALLGREVGGTDHFQHDIIPPPPAADCVRVFICAKSPASFGISGSGFGKSLGYVLYCVTLFRPEKPNG